MLDNGRAGSIWDQGVSAFDENIGYGVCSKDGGQGCPSLTWAVVNDTGRGEVLEVTYAEVGVGMAAIFIGNSTGVDMRDYASGSLKFDIKVTNAGENTTGWIIKADCTYPCTSGIKQSVLLALKVGNPSRFQYHFLLPEALTWPTSQWAS